MLTYADVWFASLSAVFYDICVVGSSSSVNVYARSVMSPIEHLLQRLVKPEHMRKGCRDPVRNLLALLVRKYKYWRKRRC